MKAIVAVGAILLFGLSSFSLAEGKKDIQTQGCLPIPAISIPEAVFNFETVLEGEMVAHTFAINNEGSSPLWIQNVKTSCGCTAANYTREAIQPGECGEVTLKFNSSGYGGKSVEKTAYVYSNDPESGKTALRIAGNVAKTADINPGIISLHGSPQETVRTVVEIIPSEDLPFHIVGEPETGKDTYRCSIEEKGGKYILTAENLARKPMIYFDDVILKTDRPEKPEIRIKVFGKIEARK